METKVENCILCYKSLDSDSLTVTENTLNLLEFLAETIFDTTDLQNGLMCSACLENIKEAVNFKTLHLAKQGNNNVEIKQETVSDENLGIYYICKDATKQNSFTSLLNSYENIASYMIQKEALDCLVNPKICNACHMSALNFERMTRFLSVYDLNKKNNAQLNSETVITDESEFKIDIFDHCLPAIKEEFEEMEQDFQNKQEELNLNVACKAGPFTAGFRSLNCKDQERSSVLQRPENLTAHTNDSNLITNIARIEMDYKESSNRLMFTHKNINEVEMFECGSCEFQTKYKNSLKGHALLHKNINDVKRFKCQNCEFQTRHKISLKQHMLAHINIGEVEVFECESCEFQTKYKRNLKVHTLKHKNINEVKLFNCHNCVYQTKLKSCLKVHQLTHKNINEVNMFKCQHCQFQTKRKQYLKEHVLIHKNNEVKMFKCQNCEFRTNHTRYLKQHNFHIHKDINEVEMFKCQNCEYQTKNKGYLKKHMLIHRSINKVKLFNCQNCEFQTKYKNSIKTHMLTHINQVSMFKCENCEFQTNHIEGL